MLNEAFKCDSIQWICSVACHSLIKNKKNCHLVCVFVNSTFSTICLCDFPSYFPDYFGHWQEKNMIFRSFIWYLHSNLSNFVGQISNRKNVFEWNWHWPIRIYDHFEVMSSLSIFNIRKFTKSLRNVQKHEWDNFIKQLWFRFCPQKDMTTDT